jgi:hypothetical protein
LDPDSDFPSLAEEKAMEDFPIWLKVIVYLIVGGTVLYMVIGVIGMIQ